MSAVAPPLISDSGSNGSSVGVGPTASVPDPFLAHLLVLLSVCELGAPDPPDPLPTFPGPREWYHDSIGRSIAAIAHRMSTAESALAAVRAAPSPDTKRPTVGGASPPPPHTSSGGPSSRDPSATTTTTPTSPFFAIDPRHTPSTAGTPRPAHHDGVVARVMHVVLGDVPAPEAECCPTCGKPSEPPAPHGAPSGGPPGSPPIPPLGLLVDAAHEGGMSAVEELQLLKSQISDVARVCSAVARGDLTQKITVQVEGVIMAQLKEVINAMVENLGRFSEDVIRVLSFEVDTECTLGGQAIVDGVEGTWADLTAAANQLAWNLTALVRSIASVTAAVARGDLSRMVDVDARGEMLELKHTVNSMVARLRAFASELARVALEVGTKGGLGEAVVPADVEGVWRELTRNVSRMCTSLTDQV